MNDREKLDEIINLINKYNQSDSVHRKGYGQVLQLMFTRYPIEHWETLESKARQAFMSRRADVDRQCNMLLNEGWVSSSVTIAEDSCDK